MSAPPSETGWKIVAHEDRRVVVEIEGHPTAVYFNLDSLVQAFLAPPATVIPTQGNPRIGGTIYRFDKGDILAEHAHDGTDLHDVVVRKGSVLLRKESGDVVLQTGDTGFVSVGERHSVEGLEDGTETIHELIIR